MAVVKCLDLSTAHIPPELLASPATAADAFGDVRCAEHEHGWTLYLRERLSDYGEVQELRLYADGKEAGTLREIVNDDGLEAVPSWLIPILERAYALGCQMTNFDHDADEDDLLVVFST